MRLNPALKTKQLYPLKPWGFLTADKISSFSFQFKPIFNYFSSCFSPLLMSIFKSIVSKHLKRTAAGAEEETPESKLQQSEKKRKERGVPNSSKYGSTVPRRAQQGAELAWKPLGTQLHNFNSQICWTASSSAVFECIVFIHHLGFSVTVLHAH